MDFGYIYNRRREIQLELNKLYSRYDAWRDLAHCGVRNKTIHRKGKTQKQINKLISEINALKRERVDLNLQLKGF